MRPERGAARNDGDLVNRVVVRKLPGHQGVPGFVVRGRLALVLADDHRPALGAHHDFVFGHLEVDHGDDVLVLAGGQERGLVDEVLQVGAGETGASARDDVELHVVTERNAPSVHGENALTPVQVGPRHDDATVEAAGAKDRRIEDVGPVGRGDDDDTLARLEAVHLDEELVEGLLALVVTPTHPGATMATDGVDLVDEDDAGRVLLPLLEQVADARGADADEHLDEIRAGDAEERDARLAGDGAREERLARARRTHEQDALGNAATETLKLLWVLQERDDLFAIVLGLVDASDVLEGDLVLRFVEEARA